jgi:hypothetical protein
LRSGRGEADPVARAAPNRRGIIIGRPDRPSSIVPPNRNITKVEIDGAAGGLTIGPSRSGSIAPPKPKCAAPDSSATTRQGIKSDRQAPRIYPQMIRLCSRFDSVLFTPKMSEIPSYGNYSRSPYVWRTRPTANSHRLSWNSPFVAACCRDKNCRFLSISPGMFRRGPFCTVGRIGFLLAAILPVPIVPSIDAGNVVRLRKIAGDQNVSWLICWALSPVSRCSTSGSPSVERGTQECVSLGENKR